MKLEMDFYGKGQMSIRSQADANEPMPDNELLLFGWFTLRQFHNINRNPAADVFAGLLHLPDMKELTQTPPRVPSINALLQSAHYAKYPIGSMERMVADPDALLAEQVELANRDVSSNHLLRTIERDFLSSIPSIIEYPGKPGDKRFIATLPPGVLDIKGFGIIGWQVNYFICHSIFGFLRWLGIRNSADTRYLERLSHIATSCSEEYMQGRITMLNQRELANLFLFYS